jgi:hypothetical protein
MSRDNRPLARYQALNKEIKWLLCGVAALFALVFGVVVIEFYAAQPDYRETYYLDVPGGGRLRNDTWTYVDSGWGGDAFQHGAVYYEDNQTEIDEVVVAAGPDERNFRRVATGALRSGSFVDFVFGDTVHSRFRDQWQEYDLSANELLALYYVPVPVDASVHGWKQSLGRQHCSVKQRWQIRLAEHELLAECEFQYASYRIAPVTARFYRQAFGAPWQLDKPGTFIESPPQRREAGWPLGVIARLDVFHRTRHQGSPGTSEWPLVKLPTTASHIDSYVAEVATNPGRGLPNETRVGGWEGAIKLYPVGLDSRENPVIMWKFYEHGSGSYDLVKHKGTMKSQRWGQPTLLESFDALITIGETVPAATYLTLSHDS